MAQETNEERKASLEKMVATELLKLAMETDEERKARLKKMVVTTQLRLAQETEDERRARLEEEDGSYHLAEVSPGDRG